MKKPPKSLTRHGNDRLILVPDSGVLMLLAAPIPKGFFIEDQENPRWLSEAKRPRHFYDILLQYMPRETIKAIHIVDAVADETFNKDKENLYPNDIDLLPLAEAARDPDNRFIVIVKTLEGQRLAEEKARLSAYPALIREYAPHMPEKTIRQTMRRMRDGLGHTNAGEAIAGQYLLSHIKPTWFLTEDWGARQRLAAAARQNAYGAVYVDNTIGFFQKLMGYDKETGTPPSDPQQNLLHRKCGFRASVKPEDIIAEMSRYKEKLPPHQRMRSSIFAALPGNPEKSGNLSPGHWFPSH